MKIDTHGLKMTGLKAAASETKYVSGFRPRGAHVQIDYDTAIGEVIAAWLADENSWVKRHDPAIIRVCDARRRYTMQEIADVVAAANGR